MRGLSSLSVGLGALRSNPLRATLSTLGVVIGVAALVAVLALGDGLERFGRRQIGETTSIQAVLLDPMAFEMVDGRPVPRGDAVTFTARDAADLAGRLDTLAVVTVMAEGTALLTADSGPTIRRAATVMATLPATAALPPVTVSAGRFFTQVEADSGAQVAVASAGIAAALGPAPLLGRDILLQGIRYRVVGILGAADSGSAGGGDLRAMVPLGAAPRGTGGTARILAFARRVEAVDSVKARASAWLTARYGDWKTRVRVRTQSDRLAQVQQGILLFKLAMGALTGISLLVGGIGIMNVLLASVIERTREIGIRRAAGARSRDILLQFLSESVAITGLGSAVGAGLGFAGAFGVTALMRARAHAAVHAAFSWSTLLVAAAAATVVGLGFGIYPALRASRLTPIDAIRHE